MLESWGKKKNVYLNQGFVELRKDGGNQVSDPVCKAASTTIVISPENKLILPCYHLGIDEFPIEDKLYTLYHSEKIQQLIALEGRYQGCEGCVINCYMQPSFAVEINSLNDLLTALENLVVSPSKTFSKSSMVIFSHPG